MGQGRKGKGGAVLGSVFSDGGRGDVGNAYIGYVANGLEHGGEMEEREMFSEEGRRI
jgi:hypothetical protein